MKKLSKIISLMLSLALCLGMASPAFAASFTDLQNAINGKEGTVDDPEYYGREEGSEEGGIAAWTQDGVRNVQLNDTVTRGDKEREIKLGNAQNVTLDLNSQKIVDEKPGENNRTIYVDTGSTLTVDDRSDEKTGVIQGSGTAVFAYGAEAEVKIEGGSVTGEKYGLYLGNKAHGTISGESTTVKGTTIGVFANGKGTEVNIEGGSVTGGERGLLVQTGAKGTVSGENTTVKGTATGVFAGGDRNEGKTEVNIEDGSVTGGKRGLQVQNGAKGTISGGLVSAENGGDGVCVRSYGEVPSQVTKTGGDISGNIVLFSDKAGNGTSEFTVGSVTYSLSAKPSEEEEGKQVITIVVKDANGETIGDTATTATVAIGTKFMPELDTANTDNPRFELTEDMLDKTAVTTNGFGGYVDSKGFHAYLCCEKAAPVEDSPVAPSCTEPGKTAGTHCSVCGKTLSGGETIPATGHTPGETRRENEVAAQIGVEGSYDEVVYCSVCGDEIRRAHVTTDPLEPPETPDVPGVIVPDPDVPMADGSGTDTTTIEDQEVPLAGLMPLAQLLEELRQYEKIEDAELPEDFKWIDHEYAQAIYWGLQEELVVDTEEEPLDPDEALTVGLMREVLTSFVELYKGLEEFVFTLEGEDDELVMDPGERLTVFYGELEAYLKAQEAKAA